jgi:hypothetical protein
MKLKRFLRELADPACGKEGGSIFESLAVYPPGVAVWVFSSAMVTRGGWGAVSERRVGTSVVERVGRDSCTL